MTDPGSDLERLQARLQKMAAEKATLHLVLQLIDKLDPLAKIDDLLGQLLHGIMDTIGGTNIKIYYWESGQLHYADFLGERKAVAEVDDPLAREVMERRAFIQWEAGLAASLLQEGMVPVVCSWGFPLLVDEDLIGIVTIENLHLGGSVLGRHLPVFFHQTALVLSNELRRKTREAAELELDRKTRELDRYFDNALDLFAIVDPGGRFRKLNQAWHVLLGYPLAELEGGLFLEFVHPDDLESTLNTLAQLQGQQPILDFVSRYRHRDGSWRWIEWHFVAEADVLYVAARDITARKRNEVELREREERYRTFFEHGPDGIVVLDPVTARPIEFNDQVCRQLGYDREEFQGLAMADIEARESPAETSRRIQRVLETGLDDFETLQRTKDGQVRNIHVTAQQIQMGGKAVYHCVWRDITERKATELERAQLQDQLTQAQKMESLGSLAGGVAHDMNNVLGAILGLASAQLRSQPEGSEAHRVFETIIKACDRGGKTVKSLLSFARRTPAEERTLDLNAILREESQLLERTLLAKVQLELDLDPALDLITGDGNALSHLFMNLCVNAVDAMPSGGTLTLRTRNRSPWVEVQIQDTGEGMSKDVLARAFDPFFTTKAPGKGTGLGLSMAFSTVRTHHGQLELQSEPGQGTLIRVLFPPCAVVPVAAEAEPALPRVSAQKLRVLLVDDDELILQSTRMLVELLGHHVTTATCGEEALASLEAGLEAEVVILDMNMPGWGGRGTLPRLRALRPAVPVLLATGRADQEAIELVAAHPGVILLPKPFGLEELQQQFQRIGGR